MASRRSAPILVVSAESELRRRLSTGLDGQGFALRHACTGREALAELVGDPRPSLVVLDPELPDSGEFDVLGIMSAATTLATIPVALLSNESRWRSRSVYVFRCCDMSEVLVLARAYVERASAASHARRLPPSA